MCVLAARTAMQLNVDLQLILTPGVLFDRAGNRLGHGRGFGGTLARRRCASSRPRRSLIQRPGSRAARCGRPRRFYDRYIARARQMAAEARAPPPAVGTTVAGPGRLRQPHVVHTSTIDPPICRRARAQSR